MFLQFIMNVKKEFTVKKKLLISLILVKTLNNFLMTLSFDMLIFLTDVLTCNTLFYRNIGNNVTYLFQ
jgi:hypothetical protein